LELGVNLFALRQDGVQLELADEAAERGLSELRGGVQVVLHLRKREIRVHHAEITDRVHLYGHVVARDDVLRRNVERLDSQ
jgi:hypothetical protein